MKLATIIALFLFSSFAYSQDSIAREQTASELYEIGLSFRTTKKDSSYFYFDAAFEIFNENKNYSQGLDVILEAVITCADFYDLERFRHYLQKIEELFQREELRKALKPSGDFDYYQNRFLYEQANYLYKLKDYNGAKEKASELRSKYDNAKIALLDGTDLTFLIYSTHILAAIAMNTGKYDLAENYFEQALDFSEKNELGKKRGLQRGTRRLLSQLYILMGRNDRADVILTDLLRKYKNLYIDDKEYKNSLVVVFQRMVNNLVQQDSLQTALDYLDESQDYLLPDDPFYKESLLLYGDIFLKLNQDQNALDHFQKALSFFKNYRNQGPHEDIAQVYGKITEFHLKKKDYQNGLATINRALNNSGKNIQLELYQNPKPEAVFSKTQLLYLLDLKLQLLNQGYSSTGNANFLGAALETDRSLLATFNQLKMEFDSKLDKQFLVETAYPIIQRMLEVAYVAFKNNGSPEMIELAINISEKNKDFLLLEATRSSNASKYGGVPQKVLDRESAMRAEITYLEKKIFDGVDTTSNFAERLLKLKYNYYSFLDTVQVKYPKYHDLKYNSKSLDLETLRQGVLETNNTLVSFTMAKDYLYALMIDGSKEDFVKLPFSDADTKDVQAFYQLLSRPSITNVNNNIEVLGEHLFNKILRKPLEEFHSVNLTIIADGVLHYLPFDMLRSNGELLLQTKTIGYGNSIASLLELKGKKKSNKNRVLAFAPSFSNVTPIQSDRQFGKLTYNDDEVSKIGSFYDTETMLAKHATLENFLSKTSDFNILHLATHASANDEYPDYSYLAFSREKDSSESNILYIKDLYNISMDADMVTLSACQTGIGKLRQGQGMLSLSKGFFYAGAKSLVNTLWKINDKSSVKLMEYYYEGLSVGKSKAKALRDAKLEYLDTTEDDLLRHPYYWAAFVVSGDSCAISTSRYWWYIGLGMLFFILLYLASKKGRKIYLGKLS